MDKPRDPHMLEGTRELPGRGDEDSFLLLIGAYTATRLKVGENVGARWERHVDEE